VLAIAEDSGLLRAGLSRLITDAGHRVVAEASDGPGLLSAVEEQRPDVAVVDVRMPPGFKDEGLKAALEARRRTPGLAVLVLSQYVEERYGRELLESGMEGTGYLLKDRVADVAEFVSALESVGSGGTVLDPEVVGQLLARRRRKEGLACLTSREGEVLALVAEGRTNRAIPIPPPHPRRPLEARRRLPHLARVQHFHQRRVDYEGLGLAHEVGEDLAAQGLEVASEFPHAPVEGGRMQPRHPREQPREEARGVAQEGAPLSAPLSCWNRARGTTSESERSLRPRCSVAL